MKKNDTLKNMSTLEWDSYKWDRHNIPNKPTDEFNRPTDFLQYVKLEDSGALPHYLHYKYLQNSSKYHTLFDELVIRCVPPTEDLHSGLTFIMTKEPRFEDREIINLFRFEVLKIIDEKSHEIIQKHYSDLVKDLFYIDDLEKVVDREEHENSKILKQYYRHAKKTYFEGMPKKYGEKFDFLREIIRKN